MGSEASERRRYKGSAQEKKDLEEKMTVMATYANKPSLISFITKLRIATGCDPLREYEIEIPFEIENEEAEETLTPVEDNLDTGAENISNPWYKSINWTNIWGYIVSIVKNPIFITVAICAAVVYGAYIGLTVLELTHLRNTSANKHELVESRSVKKTPAQKRPKTTPEQDETDKSETQRAESFDSAEEYFTNHTSDIASSYGDAHYDGFFYAGEKKFPISIYYFLTSDMSVISCRYTNVNYKTETNMDVTFNGSEMILRGLDGKNEFVMHFSPTSNGNWEGWAQSGKQRLRATLRPRR